MPEFLFDESFITNCKNLLNKNGYILFNTMNLNKNVIENYLSHFEPHNFAQKVLKNVERYNDVIIIKRI